jgi:hypothetical protein
MVLCRSSLRECGVDFERNRCTLSCIRNSSKPDDLGMKSAAKICETLSRLENEIHGDFT